MDTYTGKSIFKGIAIGKILFYQKGEQAVTIVKIQDAQAEIKRYEDATQQAIEQLNALYEKAVKEVGEVNAAVFEVHAMMLEDDDYMDSIRNMIETQQVNAEFAVATTGDNFSKMFADMEDEYFSARAADVKDISERVVNILSGKESGGSIGDEPVIIVADDLAPSETVQMDKDKLLAFVTRYGSSNSHTAILARTMNIPALIGVEISEEWNGKLAVVDGYTGSLYIEPNEETLAAMTAKQEEDRKARELLQKLKGKEDVTTDGRKIRLYANIGGVKDVANVLANDAAGIGLFRSEFLYLESEDYPNEEAQFQAYKTVAENMAGKKVVVRTLDIGADKQVDYFDLGHEENPALGYRAIRICLTRTEIFKTQLRALLRASAYGDIAIMYPMIISVKEVQQAKALRKMIPIRAMARWMTSMRNLIASAALMIPQMRWMTISTNSPATTMTMMISAVMRICSTARLTRGYDLFYRQQGYCGRRGKQPSLPRSIVAGFASFCLRLVSASVRREPRCGRERLLRRR